GDRVAVMRKGLLQQVDRPQELYDNPHNLFVAGFIGSPAMNVVEAKLERTGQALVLSFGPHALSVDENVFDVRPALKRYEGRTVVIGIRPEDFEDASVHTNAPADRRMRVEVTLVESLGSDVIVHFTLDAPVVLTDETR